MSSFQQAFHFGRIAENKIAQWLLARGHAVLPVYEVEMEQAHKGPRVIGASAEWLAPDLLAFTKGQAQWIEAKRKSTFTWHRKTGTWQTGIDRRCYDHYLELAGVSPFKLWLMFLHEESLPHSRDLRGGSPSECPTGLYGGDILKLKERIDHPHGAWGNGGMVYWRESALTLIATVQQVNALIAGTREVIDDL
jgi:hypothetical protein